MMICQSLHAFIRLVSSRPYRQALPRFTLAALALMTLPAKADLTAAQEAPKAKLIDDVVQSSGAYTKTVPISVPGFRGLEPKLALTYSSSGENGFAGVGWTVAGLSFIERASPGGGAPRYDASDIYLLDGEELVPNCTNFGGTHCPRHQTYQRISFNATTNQWTVVDKDGTKNVYSSMYIVAAGTFRWALASEADVHGNTVSYNYWCESGANCYPNTVSYNGATITFHRELRPTTDRISFANGEYLAVGNYRLRSISVKVGAGYARAYRLSYYESGTTKRSLLQFVQTYGTDVVIDANGLITGGTSLPTTTLGYTGSAATASPTISTTANNPWANLSACISGDYNQDGNSSDIACYMGGANNNEWHVWLSSPGGWVWGGYRYLVSGTSTSDISTKCLGGDFNRDGMSDVVCYAGSGSWRVGLSTGGTTTSAPTWTVQTWTGGPTVEGYLVRDRCFVGDYNGDGRSDLACHNAGWRIGLSSGSSWSNPNTLWTGPSVSDISPVTHYCFAADYNGDGKTDVSCQTGSGTGQWATYLTNSNSTNFTNAGNWAGPGPGLPVTNQCLTADLNGDGKSELACYTGTSGTWHNTLSTGKGFTGVWWTGGVAPTSTVSERCAAGDINGDNRADITCLINGSTGAWATSRSLGNGWDAVMNWTGLGGGISTLRAFCVPGDYNGDGLADFACRGSDWKAYYPLGTVGHPDLLKTVTNSLGGKETVTYAPSSRWADYNTSGSWLNLHDMPVGTVVPTVKDIKLEDGRGTVETVPYRYEFAKWSHNLKQFVGFQRADAHPAGGACIISRFRQTDASPGALEELSTYASVTSLVPLHKRTRTFTETQTAPYTSLVDEEEEREQHGQSTSYRTGKKKHFYDGYGNPYMIYDYGDAAIASDDKTFYSWHYPSSTDYVVDKPGFVNTYAGIGTAGALIAQTLYHYDNGAYYYTPPTKGSLTKLSQWDNQRGAPNADTSVAYSNTTYGHDSFGNLITTTDAAGRVTNVTYNDPTNTTYNNVFPIKTCNALNHCTSTKWDLASGQPLEATDPNGAVAKMGYDPLGRKTSETDPLNNVTTWSYFSWGTPTSQGVQEIRPDGSAVDGYGIVGSWTNTYMDGFGRTWLVYKEGLTTTTFAGQQTIYKDSSSKVWKKSNWYTNGATPVYTVYDYDHLNRLTTVTQPDGSTITSYYTNDSAGKPYVSTTSEMGQETRTWDDANGNAVKVEELVDYVYVPWPEYPSGEEGDWVPVYATTTFEYDRLGNKVKTTDAAGNITTATYDSLGRKLTETRAGGATWTYTYNKDGQINTEKDNKNQITTLTYDAAGRPKTKVAGSQTTTWYYDEAGYGASIGRPTRISYPGGSKEMTYSIRGEVIIDKPCVKGLCRTQNLSYDNIGRLKTVTYPSLGGLPVETVTYTYDAAGQLYSMSGYISAMTWNPAGQLLSMTYTNGTTNTYTYDTNREWLKTANAKLTSTGATLYTASYGYDLSARVTSMTQGTPTAVTTGYTYDPLNRLTEVKNAAGSVIQSYTYNAIGNITYNSQVGSYTYHPTHKHAVAWAAGSRNYEYDSNGSMVSAAGNGPSITMAWDAENRMTSLNRDGVVTTFAYDEDEERVHKTNGTVGTYYFNKLIEKVGDIHEFYYYAGPILVAKKRIEPTANYTRWYHSDRLNSTRLMTNATGVEVRDYDYKAFGATASTTGSASNERGYTGHITDAESSLIYMGARYYDATLGRFISADSIIPDAHNPQALNRYSYVYNNPINNVDPTGHIPMLLAVPLASAIGGALIGAGASALTGSSIEWIIADALIGFGGGVTGASALKGVRAIFGKKIFNLKENQIQKMTERASFAVFGVSYANASGFSAHLKGKKGSALFAAYAMGFAGGTAGVFGRGLGFKKGFLKSQAHGKRMTYGDVLRLKYGKKGSAGWRSFFKTIKGGLAASFMAGAAAKAGLHWGIEYVKWAGSDGNYSELAENIDRRIAGMLRNFRKHRKHYDDGDIESMKRTIEGMRDFRFELVGQRQPGKCQTGGGCKANP